MSKKKVFVSGCYDLLHSGHVEFFRQAAEYGDLYVGIGSDKTIEEYKHHKTVYSEQERLFISLEPTFEPRERCGLSTSTRNAIKKIWPYNLPNMNPEMLARLVFCFENDPERSDGIISGAQDSIGICVPGLCRHYYNNRFWPEKIETCYDEDVLQWLENHLVMIPMDPREPGCSVVDGKDINETNVKTLASAADRCWTAIINKDLQTFASAYMDSFNAQTAMFPAMIQGCVQSYIEKYKNLVLAYKMPGAGGGGYLACVVKDAELFSKEHQESIRLTIRKPGM